MSTSSGGDFGQAAIEAVRAAPGSDEAWSRFYRYYRRQVAAAALMAGATRTEVPDITHDVFHRFVQSSPWSRDWTTLPDRPFLTGYLSRIARNLVIDGYRRRQRSATRDDGVELDELAAPAEHSDVPLAHLLQELGDDDRQLLQWLVDGVPLTNIAGNLGVSYSAAGVRVHRLRRRIEKLSLPQKRGE